MNTTDVNNTEIIEMMQTLMNEGLQGFPAVMARIYNLAMRSYLLGTLLFFGRPHSRSAELVTLRGADSSSTD